MRFRCVFWISVCILFTALPNLWAQDGGRRDRGFRSFWGGGGNRSRGGDPGRSSPPRENQDRDSASSDAGPANDSSESSDSKTPPAVPGFGENKKLAAVPGFSDPPKKDPAKKSSAPAASSDAKPAKTADSPSSRASKQEEQIRKYTKSQLDQYDDNKNGQLEPGEWAKMKSKYKAADKNKDGTITLDELTAFRMAEEGISSSEKTDRKTGPTSQSPPHSDASAGKPFRFLTSTERLPEGLPDWFARKDADGDGQISMAEFSSFWTADKAREFSQYDKDNDGIITPAECLGADTKK
jgi:Ca2+-binding EF-hand superfamily protein